MANKQATRSLGHSLLASSSPFRPASSLLPSLAITHPRLAVREQLCQPVSISAIPSPRYASRSRGASKPREKESSMPQKKRKPYIETGLSSASILIPMTFVTPPLSRYPRDSIRSFAHFGWLAFRNRAVNYVMQVLHKLYSKEAVLKRARYKMRKGAIVPAAKALHLQMNEAIARGDKEALRRICTQEFYEKLAGAVDARPRGVRTEWELVRYDGGWTRGYPRLTDDKIQTMALSEKDSRIIRQAVVSISSVQRMAKYDDRQGGVILGGGPKVQSVLEHLVLTATVDPDTFQQSEWRIWGTLPESTLEDYLAEQRALEFESQQQMKS